MGSIEDFGAKKPWQGRLSPEETAYENNKARDAGEALSLIDAMDDDKVIERAEPRALEILDETTMVASNETERQRQEFAQDPANRAKFAREILATTNVHEIAVQPAKYRVMALVVLDRIEGDNRWDNTETLA